MATSVVTAVVNCFCPKIYQNVPADEIIKKTECVICLEYLDNGDDVVQRIACGHQYHRRCADYMGVHMRGCASCGDRLERVTVAVSNSDAFSDYVTPFAQFNFDGVV